MVVLLIVAAADGDAEVRLSDPAKYDEHFAAHDAAHLRTLEYQT